MTTSFLKELTLLMPIWSLFLFSLVPLVIKTLNKNKEPRSFLVFAVYFLGVLNSLLLFLFLGFQDHRVLGLHFDMHNTGAACLVALAGLISLPLFFFNKELDEKQITETLFLHAGSLIFLYIFCLAEDFILAFIGLEGASLITYILISISRNSRLALESSIKYFLLSSFAGLLFLYGISFLFGSLGSFQLEALNQQEAFQLNRFFYLGLILIFSAGFFKIALFPFQYVLPEVYQGALTPVTLYLTTGFKASVVLFLAKIFNYNVFSSHLHGKLFLEGFAALACLSVIYASVQALKQTKLKRLFAFSSLVHSGYIAMVLSQILKTGHGDMRIIFYYLTAYILATGGLFTVLQFLQSKKEEVVLEDLQGLFKVQPLVACFVSVFFLALAGLPPTFGFFSKLALFQPLIEAQNWWLVFWMLVGSAIGLYYYIKPITLMVAGDSAYTNSPGGLKTLMAILAFLTFFGSFILGLFFHV